MLHRSLASRAQVDNRVLVVVAVNREDRIERVDLVVTLEVIVGMEALQVLLVIAPLPRMLAPPTPSLLSNRASSSNSNSNLKDMFLVGGLGKPHIIPLVGLGTCGVTTVVTLTTSMLTAPMFPTIFLVGRLGRGA